jgi:hypothetical protein
MGQFLCLVAIDVSLASYNCKLLYIFINASIVALSRQGQLQDANQCATGANFTFFVFCIIITTPNPLNDFQWETQTMIYHYHTPVAKSKLVQIQSDLSAMVSQMPLVIT